MPKFSYSALRENGELVTGQIEAANTQSVVQRLEAVQQHAVRIDLLDGGGRSWGLRRAEPTHEDVSVFTRELAWLLRAGLTLTRSLEVLAGEFQAGPMRALLAQLRTAVRSGDTFSDALARYRRTFPPQYVNMVRIAETSGTLATVLERIAEARERSLKVRRKTQSALIYPAILVAVAAASILFVLMSVVPRLHGLLGEPGAAVPDSARNLIAVSDWLVANGWTLLVLLVLSLVFGIALFRRSSVRAYAYSIALRTPVLGRVLRLSVAAEFCRAFGILLTAGVGLPTALDLMRGAFGISELGDMLGRMLSALRKGDDYLAPMEASWLFPSLVPRMLRVGAETGNLVPALQQLSSMFEEKLEVAVERMLTMLEPLIILALSAVVGLIILTVMGAIISVNDLAL